MNRPCRRRALLAPALLLALAACRASVPELQPVPGESVFYTFEKYQPGLPPESLTAGWVAGVAPRNAAFSQDEPTPWIVEDAVAPPSGHQVLRRTVAESGRAALATLRNANYGNLRAGVSTTFDAEGADLGLVWHVRDEGSAFLVLRADTRARKLRIEEQQGTEVRVLGETPFPFVAGRWFSLQAEQAGTHIRCGIDGVVLIEADAEAPSASGSVGVAHFGGALASFDNLAVIGESR